MYTAHDVGMDSTSERAVHELMEGFAARTGLSPAGPQRRYLWTDAFALTNYLTLYRRTGDGSFRDLGVTLIDQVHHVLGRYRSDDPRAGWISGLEGDEAERHPTVGGLRIGKERGERGPTERYDPEGEWDRDGQYYHYLVRWMHALARAAAVLGDPELRRWAVELAVVAHRRFTHGPSHGATRRIYWKMSVDLTRTLVPSEGGHDPLDGMVTLCELQPRVPRDRPDQDLSLEIADLARMCGGRDWATADPLGAGGLLADASWAAQMLDAGVPGRAFLQPLLAPMVEAAVASLHAVLNDHIFRLPPERRLGFRELGLAIGLRAAPALLEASSVGTLWQCGSAIAELPRYLPLAEIIIGNWLKPEARAARSWTAHEDINDVMLATALIPDEHVRV
jgi:hypothetical protein